MGYALQTPDCKAVRRRPNKALRQNNRHAGNLATYTHTVSRKYLERNASQNLAQPEEAKCSPVEYAKWGAQPFEKTAANSDTASENSDSWLSSVTKNQLTIALVGCLCTGALVGHQWSTLANQSQSFGNSVTATPVVVEVATAKRTETTVPVAVLPVAIDAVLPVANDSISREQQYVEEEKRYRSEINWLKNQNSDLLVKVDTLNLETVNQNQELLELELEVIMLQSQSEPPTETRIVYNFVNVPINGATDMQYDDQTNYNNAADDLEDVDYENERLLREWELERASYDEQDEVVYDPETGYYINPNYSGESDDYGEQEEGILSYPPIGNE